MANQLENVITWHAGGSLPPRLPPPLARAPPPPLTPRHNATCATPCHQASGGGAVRGQEGGHGGAAVHPQLAPPAGRQRIGQLLRQELRAGIGVVRGPTPARAPGTGARGQNARLLHGGAGHPAENLPVAPGHSAADGRPGPDRPVRVGLPPLGGQDEGGGPTPPLPLLQPLRIPDS